MRKGLISLNQPRTSESKKEEELSVRAYLDDRIWSLVSGVFFFFFPSRNVGLRIARTGT